MAVLSHRRTSFQLDELLSAVRRGKPLEDESIRFMLGVTEPGLVGRIFQAARKARDEHFGNKIFLYGFVYFSTFCRNDCVFCQYRQGNPMSLRYRKSSDEILAASDRLAEAGVHLIDLTMGEDPQLLGEESGDNGFLLDRLREVKKSTGLPLMISPGVVPTDYFGRLAGAGADWYACYQETHTRSLFTRLRQGQSFDGRWEAKLNAKASGMLIEEGILTGVGETADDISASFSMMRMLDPDQVRVMTFVPQPGTPMQDSPAPDSLRELLIIAMLRLAFSDRLIPASLDIEGLEGLQLRLDAGANVVTSLIAPGAGLAGVASLTRGIEDSMRMPSAVSPVLSSCGLTAASRGDYADWMRERRRAARSGKSG
jgi:methylornithine synthase